MENMNAQGHATKASAELVRLECQLDAIADKLRKQSFAMSVERRKRAV